MLGPGQPDAELVEAAAANQTEWMVRIATAAGGEVHRDDATWMSSPAGAVLAFPRLARAKLDALLPRFLEAAGTAPEASCWSLVPTKPRELGDVLRAHGFRDGWEANWMAAEIDHVPEVAPPPGVRIEVVESTWASTELPWDGAGISAVRVALARDRPRRVWHVGAWRDERPVGHGVVSVTAGRLGVAGVYDMGVATHERRRGIGRALTASLLRLGSEAGAEIATLNATPEGMLLYEALGFRSVGIAQTWWR